MRRTSIRSSYRLLVKQMNSKAPPREYKLMCYFFADFNSKTPTDNTPVHIINVDIQDNQEEATIGAFFIWELVQLVKITVLIDGFSEFSGHSIST